MALISCPECGAQVSDKALSCPSCGHPINAPVHKHQGVFYQVLNIGWMGIAIALAIIGLFALLGTCNWKPV